MSVVLRESLHSNIAHILAQEASLRHKQRRVALKVCDSWSACAVLSQPLFMVLLVSFGPRPEWPLINAVMEARLQLHANPLLY